MVNAQQAYARYQSTAIQTAGPEQLLIMLYNGLLQKLERARLAIQGGDPAEAGVQLVNCQDIVLELTNTLNMDYEISHALAALYDWFYRRLVDANVSKSVQPLDEIQPRIAELREAWVMAADQIRRQSTEMSFTSVAVEG